MSEPAETTAAVAPGQAARTAWEAFWAGSGEVAIEAHDAAIDAAFDASAQAAIAAAPPFPLAMACTARDGDTVVIAFRERITREMAARLCDRWASHAPGVKVIVVDGADEASSYRRDNDSLRAERNILRGHAKLLEAERDRLSDRVEEVTGQLRAVTDERDELRALIDAGQPTLATELLSARAELAQARQAHDTWAAQLAAELAAELADAHRERDKLHASGIRLMGLIEMYVRSLYAVKIDVIRGDTKAVMEALSEGLDGFDGPEWNGTETGTEWLERTREDDRGAAALAPAGSSPETAVEWAVFYGGPDPDNCAGRESMPDQGMAEVAAQWRVDSGIARRTVAYGPWEVMAAEDDGSETASVLADPETMAAVAEGERDA